MGFNFDAYEKVFPTNPVIPPAVDSAVDTFKPTEEEAIEKAMDNKPGATDEVITEESEEIGDKTPEGNGETNG